MLNRRILILAAAIILGVVLVSIGFKTPPVTPTKAYAASDKPSGVSPSPPRLVSPGVTAGTAVPAQDGFFAEYRMHRDRAFSLEAALLENVVNNPLSSAQTRQNAQSELLGLSREQASLVNLEGLAHAEGYSEAAVFLKNQGVTVVVGPGQITTRAAVRLVQVLAQQAGIPAANVTIIQRP